MKKSKLTLEKFKIAELSNPSKINGGDGPGDKTTMPTQQCRQGSDIIIDQ